MGKPAVVVDNVSMKFNLSKEKVDNLKDYLIKFIKKEIKYNEFWALQNVNFEVQKGDRVGILGLNGAGKSTLLKVIAGVFKPTEGKVIKNGRLVPLLELGAGFDPQYTGRENIYLYGAMLGYSKSFIEEKFDEIVEFSELKEFIDVPIKNYSSGMKARLGFSIATLVSPDILILDEPTAGLDPKGRDDILDQIAELHKVRGITIVLVSHSMEDIAKYVERLIVMNHGEAVFDDTPKKVFSHYKELETMGLAAPQITYIMHALKEHGLNVDADATTVEEARDSILAALKASDSPLLKEGGAEK